MRCLWGFALIVCLLLPQLHAQSKYWELKQGDLKKIVRSCDVILDGKPLNKSKSNYYAIRPYEIFLGPQSLDRKKYIWVKMAEHKAKNLSSSTSYIFFLKKDGKSYKLYPLAKSLLKKDLFLASRVRQEAMRCRAERSSNITLVQIKAIAEKKIKGKNILVTAMCVPVQNYKGSIKSSFQVQYIRISKADPPLFFFSRI